MSTCKSCKSPTVLLAHYSMKMNEQSRLGSGAEVCLGARYASQPQHSMLPAYAVKANALNVGSGKEPWFGLMATRGLQDLWIGWSFLKPVSLSADLAYRQHIDRLWKLHKFQLAGANHLNLSWLREPGDLPLSFIYVASLCGMCSLRFAKLSRSTACYVGCLLLLLLCSLCVVQAISPFGNAQFQSSASTPMGRRLRPHVAMYHLVDMFPQHRILDIFISESTCKLLCQQGILQEPVLQALFRPMCMRSAGVFHELQALLCMVARHLHRIISVLPTSIMTR